MSRGVFGRREVGLERVELPRPDHSRHTKRRRGVCASTARARTSSVKSDALSVLVDGHRLKRHRGRRIHPVVVLLPPPARLRRKCADRWSAGDLTGRCYRRGPRHVLNLQRPTARPHITPPLSTISIAPDPAICVPKTTSAIRADMRSTRAPLGERSVRAFCTATRIGGSGAIIAPCRTR